MRYYSRPRLIIIATATRIEFSVPSIWICTQELAFDLRSDRLLQPLQGKSPGIRNTRAS